MLYNIRKMTTNEYNLLDDFLYEAIFQPDQSCLAPRTIINKPELQVYIKDFGAYPDDYCLCAEADKRVVGAVWVRCINGYGNIGESIPEFAISVLKEYRGQGIGTALMTEMLEHLKSNGYSKASLAVQKENYALKMYLNVGFEIIDENREEYIMVYNLS